MNKKLFENVKGKCKDTGLSEKYLNTITDKMGGSIADDSTDETAIETMANQIADIAKESQGEATRWVNAKKPADPKPADPKSDPKPDPKPADPAPKQEDDPNAKEIAELRTKVADMEAKQTAVQRNATIEAAIVKHGLTDSKLVGFYRDHFKAYPEEDVEKYLSDRKQAEITDGLLPQSPEGAKAATEAGTDEAAKSMLSSITVNNKEK